MLPDGISRLAAFSIRKSRRLLRWHYDQGRWGGSIDMSVSSIFPSRIVSVEMLNNPQLQKKLFRLCEKQMMKKEMFLYLYIWSIWSFNHDNRFGFFWWSNCCRYNKKIYWLWTGYNQFRDDHNQLYTTKFDDMIFKYEIERVNFTDGYKLEL